MLDTFTLDGLRALELDLVLITQRISQWEDVTFRIKGMDYDQIKIQQTKEPDEKIIKELQTKMELEKDKADLIELLRYKETYFYRILRHLTDPNYKTVLVLYYIENKTIQRISKELNFSKQHVRRIKQQAKEMFNIVAKSFPYEPFRKMSVNERK